MEPNQIARSCQILSPSLTRMLAGMEEQGLIKRVRSSADQRRQEISLTPKSNKLIDRMRPQVDAKYQEIESKIGKELLDRLYRDVDAMVDQIKRDAPASRDADEA
jgi:homoprotocatechuate degradation regulator HpaR